MAKKNDCCFFGRGKLGIACIDADGSWGIDWGVGWGEKGAVLPPIKPVGNVSSLALNIDFEQKQVLNLSTGFYENDCSVCIVNNVTFNMTLNCVSNDNLKLALLGDVRKVAAKGGTETHSVCPNSDVPFECGTFIPFNAPGVDKSSVVVELSDNSLTLVENQHYICDQFGIELLTGFQLGAGVTMDLTYAYSTDYTCIEALTSTCKNVKMIFRGVNLADGNAPFMVVLHNVKLSPASALSLISEDFTTLDITGTLEADTSIMEAGHSKYFKIIKLGS